MSNAVSIEKLGLNTPPSAGRCSLATAALLSSWNSCFPRVSHQKAAAHPAPLPPDRGDFRSLLVFPALRSCRRPESCVSVSTRCSVPALRKPLRSFIAPPVSQHTFSSSGSLFKSILNHRAIFQGCFSVKPPTFCLF